jgi:glyoxylase-like metal-dependent hydrolase (beta-lactamase superfamily II)
MIQLAENVYAVTKKAFFSSPVFIIEKKNGKLTLVDTGLTKDVSSFITQINEKWGSLENVERIIFTHRHGDHIQGLRAFLDEMITISAEAPPEEKIEIVFHEAEGPLFVKDQKDRIIKPNRLVKHEEIIDKELTLQAIHTPGHTYGHLCLLIKNRKLLLIGDLIMLMFGNRLRPVFKLAHDDYKLHFETLPRILNYEWDFAIPSHMKPVKIPREKIENYIKKKTRQK